MSIVSLCVILIEVPDTGELLPSLTFVAPCYTEMNANRERKGERVSVEGSPGVLRGKRPQKTYSVETYTPKEPVGLGESKSFTSIIDQSPSGSSSLTDDNTTTAVEKDTPGPISKSYRVAATGDLMPSIRSISSTDSKAYISGNPFVEVTKGVLHLFKENEVTVFDKNAIGKSKVLVMLAVPTFLSCTDVLQFLSPYQRDLQHMKVIRDSVPNQYMVLLTFKTQEGADTCFREMNGKNFNSFEDDHCHLAYVSRVETLKESDGGGQPLSGYTELPTCPVCLERMDESVDGILTILCNHSFHSNCLSKWSDSSCPVCRYVQTPEMVATNQCSECGSSESLWICLICGHIGCGRYVHGHAYKHFCETQHCYAIQPDNNRVWDYVSDSFVHRLLQNKCDGKMVELSGRYGPRHDEKDDAEGGEEKIDAMQLEFTYLLTSQLQSQRNYFEERLSLAEKDMRSRTDFLMGKLELIETDRQSLESKLSAMQKEKVNLEKKIAQLTQKLVKATTDVKEEKEFNKCLEKDTKGWKEQIAKLESEYNEYKIAKEAEISDLKEQLRDVMFFLESKSQIEKSIYKDEIVDGQVTVDESSVPSTSKKANRKKKR